MILKIFNKNKIIFALLILQNLIASSQNSYEFFGAIKLNGDDATVISYRLFFEELNGKINGYSVTDLDGAHETKNVITGTYNKKEKLFTFKENEILYTKSQFSENSFCFVNFSGKVKLIENTSKLIGDFKGLYKNKNKCIDGTITLIGSNKIYNLVNKVNKKIQKSKKIDIETKEKNNPIKLLDDLKINKLSKDQNLNVFWETKTITIEIFDSGKEDGDIVNLYNGSKIILSNYKVTNKKKTITIELDSTNKTEFVIEAINEGTITPNTSKIILIDKNRTFELMSNLNKKDKASITFIKKDASK